MADVELRAVNDTNREAVLALRVRPGQEGYIETTAQCLKDAADCPHYRPLALYHGGNLVGFAMVGLFPREGDGGRLWLDRLLLDARWQGQGLGRKALATLIAFLLDEYGPQDLYLSIYKDNEHALRLYEQFGFAMNGELDAHGEKVMVRRLTR